MKFVPDKVTRSVAKKVFVAKKNSPHIFFVGGVAGVFVSTVLACRATLHLEDALDEIKTDIDSVKAMGKSETRNPDYTEEAYYKDLGFVYGKAGGKLTKLYGPSAVIGFASIAALTGSHVQMTRRNAYLGAAFAALSKAYDEYRVRVIEELGPEREYEIYSGIEEGTLEVDGKKSKVPVISKGGTSPSIYARSFNASNPNWRKNADYNRMYLSAQEKYANDRLRARGYLFLNEVYESLDLEWSHAGQIVGWIWDSENGDNYVDFGINEYYNFDALTSHEPEIWLDFNVDGPIEDCAF